MPVNASMPVRIHETQGNLSRHATGFLRHLQAGNLSVATRETYSYSINSLARYLEEHGLSTDVANIGRDQLQAWLNELLTSKSPATAANRYSGTKAFFTWLEDEGDIDASPFRRLPKPKLPERLPTVMSQEQIAALLATCAGRTLVDRRDTALVRVFLATGARLSEITRLTLEDVDLDTGVIKLIGKGNRERHAYIGVQAIKALDRYIRARPADTTEAALWIGRAGPMTPSGVRQALVARAEQAGLVGFHPHQFRHYFAHYNLGHGMSEGNVMQLAGWRSPAMLRRYAASTRSERAIEAARQLNPSDALKGPT